jgi:diguanylate cyclase (GGDEF)-like protein
MRGTTFTGDAADPAELRFRTDSVPAGVWVTFIVCVAGLGYVAGWSHRHPAALGIIIGAAAIGGGVTLAMPWEAIVRSRWREAAFGAWSLLDIGVITALAAINGGGASVFTFLLVIPIVFAGLSYPRWLVVAVSLASVVSYVVLAVASGTRGDFILMFGATLASTALMSVWQARNHERRRAMLAEASRTDPMTGSLNRRGFQIAAATMLAGVARLGHPATLLLLDLDDFKRYNDTHGHAAGDELLCWTVDRIRSSLRPTDAVARLGGDEFAVLLAGADRASGEAAARRIRTDLAVRVASSSGLASAPADGGDIGELYRRADAELYEVKRERLVEPVRGPLRSVD